MKKRKQFIKEFFNYLNLTEEQLDTLLAEILTATQFKIFKLRYDSYGCVKNTMPDIAKEMGTTRQNIEQRLNTIFKRINIYCEKHDILINPDANKSELYPTKTEQLINTIDSIHNLPPVKGKNKMIFDVDGTIQRLYYNKLQKNASIIQEKMDNDERITDDEKRMLEDFQEIEKHLEKIVPSHRVLELVESINELKRLPRTKKLNGGRSEKKFSNGVDQRRFYDVLVADIKRIKLKDQSSLSRLEKQKLVDYNFIMEVLNRYADQQRHRYAITSYEKWIDILKSKTENYIETMIKHKKGNLNKIKSSNPEDLVFDDGSDKILFCNNLRSKVASIKRKAEQGREISLLDKAKIQCNERIKNVESFFPNKYYKNKMLIKELCNQYNIDYPKNTKLIAKSYGEVYSKLMYLIENNMPITCDNGELNKIFYMADLNMQAEFGISLDDIVSKYIYGDTNVKETLHVFRKLP